MENVKVHHWLLLVIVTAVLGLIVIYPNNDEDLDEVRDTEPLMMKLPSLMDDGIFWFNDTGEEKPVRFSHFDHQRADPDCRTCHDLIFLMERGSTDAEGALNKANMTVGLYCGRCHNGTKAFSVNEECERCHVDNPNTEN